MTFLGNRAFSSFLPRLHSPAALIVFVVLAVHALNANPFSQETVAPFDRLLQFPGWASIPSGHTAVHVEQSDILDSQLPTWITLKDQIRKGESPLWYPNGAGGQPISLEICNPGFLLFLIIEDNALAYYVVGLAKLVIAGFGLYLLLRIFLSWLPSVGGGLIFMLCGFNAAWFFWEHVTTAIWIPWLLWATVMYLKTDNRRWLPAITVTALLLIFGGFFSVAAFGFYAFALLILVWNTPAFFSRHAAAGPTDSSELKMLLEKTALPLLAVCIAFLMAAITIIPFRDSISGINMSSRSGGTAFRINDLLLFFSYDSPRQIERTAYIGIPSFICTLIGIFSAFRSKDGNLRRFVFFNALLVVFSILIVFGLLPHSLIRALPVFHNNPWGRLIVVTLLALSALCGVGLDLIGTKLQDLSARYAGLSPVVAKRIIAAALIGVIAVQFQSQKNLFNGFNAVVPAAWFYPLTPSINYVKERLQPLQSVIADTSSYWFAGTLGAYNIPEWYAHSFRTDREKEVLGEILQNRSKSPTSTAIDGKSIHFNSPLMDKLAIRYLLLNRDVGNKRLLELPELSTEAAPPLPYNSWKQHISIPEDLNAGAIGFSFGTYGDEYAPANVRLTLYEDKSGKYLLESSLGKNEISEKEWAFFPFPDKTILRRGDYYLVLSLPGYTGPKSLTAWSTKTQGKTGSFLEVNGARTDLSLKWKIGYFDDMALVSKKWNIISIEKDIVIYENRLVTNSAYFVKDLGPSNERLDFSGLDVKQASVDRIDINNSQTNAGWIVLPMRLHPGWKAYINNRQIDYTSYLDILPAIPVNGPAHVIFKYEPESFRRGLTISLAGILTFFVFSGFCLRKAKSPSTNSG